MFCLLGCFFFFIYPCLSLLSPSLLLSFYSFLHIMSYYVFILLSFSVYHVDMSSHLHLQAILTANPCISSSSSQYYTGSSNSSSGVTGQGQGQGQGQGNVGIAFGLDVQGRQLIPSLSHTTRTHTPIHTFILAYIYTFIHLYIYTFTHLYIYTFIHLYIYTFILTYAHAHTCIHLHKHTLSHTCIHTLF